MDSSEEVLTPPTVTLFLCGDVMTGRGIDQILSYPSHPAIHEDYLQQATDYVKLAELKSGPIPRMVAPEYIWGDALEDLKSEDPDARIINLETTITTSEDWFHKGINYRMHPRNVPCLRVAQVDVCVLSNNHILDWGEHGLLETVESLKQAGIQVVGAGATEAEAQAPAIIDLSNRANRANNAIKARGRGRVVVLAYGALSSGIPNEWEAQAKKPGVNLLHDFSDNTLSRIRDQVTRLKRTGDIVVFSVHWGDNWGYEVPFSQRKFARGLIDHARVDVIHGHSSHHVRGIEVYHGKLIVYGCGDLITDYEGIAGYEEFRGDLTLMYFPILSPATGELLSLKLIPMKMDRFQLKRPSLDEIRWLENTLLREGKASGTSVMRTERGFDLKWKREL